MKEYANHGLRFLYPADWVLADESGQEDVAVTLQSAGSTFWTITLLPASVSAEEALDSAVNAYREDYPGADLYPRKRTEIAGRETLRQDIDFVCMELIAAARLTAFRCGSHTILTVAQGADEELDGQSDLLNAMTISVHTDDEDSAWPTELMDQ